MKENAHVATDNLKIDVESFDTLFEMQASGAYWLTSEQYKWRCIFGTRHASRTGSRGKLCRGRLAIQRSSSALARLKTKTQRVLQLPKMKIS